ncbi:Cytochrome P450 family ent-kaurenoic acid oxidase [Quillaja saponaria]|uniref:Cytochrome P450 family ent-kaurenoic acid oxidase n=1 Tax=Quillaja saponaria TaxID=32244 RepID=A0AAD7LCG5_QUISA|nr:Cytochrome P450 family ent-kaurenoic acid oxidase [Quillaja saponaria]
MELYWSWMSTLVALLGGYVFVFGFVRRFNEWYYIGLFKQLGKNEYPLPPGDLGWPLIGNLFTFIKAFRSKGPDSIIYNLVSRYGRTGMYKTHLLGKPGIIVCAPEICRRVLNDDEKFTIGYPKTMLRLAGKKSLHGMSKAEHRRLRRLMTSPIVGHNALAAYIDLIEDIVICSLEECASMSTKHPVELLNELKKASFKVITHIFMGSNSDSILMKEVEDLFTHVLNGQICLPINIPGFTFHKALQAREKLARVIGSIVEQRKLIIMEASSHEQADYIDEGSKKKDWMDILLKVEDENGQKLEDDHIIDLLFLLLLAGHDTSAVAMMWSTIHLVKHPQILKKAKEEQEAILKSRPSSQERLNMKEIKQMKYLAKVIDEMLRLTNINISALREANVDVNINGYMIPKGWRVLIWPRGVHMDPENYPNPQEFNPSRWDNYNAKPGYFIPFGAGSMLCPGIDLVKLEITIFLHYLLLNYKVELVNPEFSVSYLPLPKPTDSCLAKVIKVSCQIPI